MECASGDESQRDRQRSSAPHGLITLLGLVLIMCASIVWGLATLDCPTGKGKWGTCNPPPDVMDTQRFLHRLLGAS